MGNSGYDASLGQLKNPANDARAMSSTLKSVGFQVELAIDLDQKAMKAAIARFGVKLSVAGKDSTGVFFYAGHGLQSRGINYLIPIRAEITRDADIDLEAVAADTVLRQMEDANIATSIVILDACRNTPVLRGMRSPTRGLAPMDAPGGSFIAYSTAPGRTALDGDGVNSPFVTALSRELIVPGEQIEVVFRNVRKSVMATTDGQQIPWDSSSLTASFAFNHDTTIPPGTSVDGPASFAKSSAALPMGDKFLLPKVRFAVEQARLVEIEASTKAKLAVVEYNKALRVSSLVEQAAQRGKAGEAGYGQLLVSTDGTKGNYFGEVKNGQPNGLGVIIYPNGQQSRGNWVSGGLSGNGIIKKEKLSIAGMFDRGKMRLGITSFPNGDRYEGEFNGEFKTGLGIYYSGEQKNFLKTIGRFDSDQITGAVVLIEKDGKRVMGITDSAWNGYFAHFDEAGRIIEQGHYVDDKLVPEPSAKTLLKSKR